MSLAVPVRPPPGIYAPAPTFFLEDGHAIDYDAQAAHAAYLARGGISGVVCLGLTGEFAHTTREERAQLVKVAVEVLGPERPVMAGVALNGLDDAAAEIELAAAAGARYAMVLPSNYFGVSITQEGLKDWYTRLADRAAIPILLYMYPGVLNNVPFTPQTAVELLAHPNIVGAKVLYGDVAHHILIGMDPEVRAANFTTLTGIGQVLLPVMTVGTEGAIDSLANVFPKLMMHLWRLCREGLIDEAREVMYTVARGEEIVNQGDIIGVKYALQQFTGINRSELGRLPMNLPLAPGLWELLRPVYDEMVQLENLL